MVLLILQVWWLVGFEKAETANSFSCRLGAAFYKPIITGLENFLFRSRSGSKNLMGLLILMVWWPFGFENEKTGTGNASSIQKTSTRPGEFLTIFIVSFLKEDLRGNACCKIPARPARPVYDLPVDGRIPGFRDSLCCYRHAIASEPSVSEKLESWLWDQQY